MQWRGSLATDTKSIKKCYFECSMKQDLMVPKLEAHSQERKRKREVKGERPDWGHKNVEESIEN